ncbi:type II secretion system protein [bacterium]|nr:type II secretion system protein [bacterium]
MKLRTIRDSGRGFALLDSMISIVILLVVISSLTAGAVKYMKYNRTAELKTTAALVAQKKLEEYRQQDPASLPTSGSVNSVVTSGGRNFTATTTFCSLSTFCDTNSRHVKVSVSYQSVSLGSLETVYTQLK